MASAYDELHELYLQPLINHLHNVSNSTPPAAAAAKPKEQRVVISYGLVVFRGPRPFSATPVERALLTNDHERFAQALKRVPCHGGNLLRNCVGDGLIAALNMLALTSDPAATSVVRHIVIVSQTLPILGTSRYTFDTRATTSHVDLHAILEDVRSRKVAVSLISARASLPELQAFVSKANNGKQALMPAAARTSHIVQLHGGLQLADKPIVAAVPPPAAPAGSLKHEAPDATVDLGAIKRPKLEGTPMPAVAAAARPTASAGPLAPQRPVPAAVPVQPVIMSGAATAAAAAAAAAGRPRPHTAGQPTVRAAVQQASAVQAYARPVALQALQPVPGRPAAALGGARPAPGAGPAVAPAGAVRAAPNYAAPPMQLSPVRPPQLSQQQHQPPQQMRTVAAQMAQPGARPQQLPPTQMQPQQPLPPQQPQQAQAPQQPQPAQGGQRQQLLLWSGSLTFQLPVEGTVHTFACPIVVSGAPEMSGNPIFTALAGRPLQATRFAPYTEEAFKVLLSKRQALIGTVTVARHQNDEINRRNIEVFQALQTYLQKDSMALNADFGVKDFYLLSSPKMPVIAVFVEQGMPVA